ncbi:hypothetical protein [Streptococcus dysgalactiae]|uniref:Cap15 family cyclic dinucleotide receptor domain-containing protein n=1 Tax=Streptococcus dysgalactiae TaxID=1334 RepID=UPI003A5D623A
MITLKANNEIGVLLYSLFGFVGESIGIGTIFLFLFEKWIWRFSFIPKLHGTPVLATKYAGTIHSNYDDKDRPANLVVNQSFLKIVVKLGTQESSSGSLNADIQEINGQNTLVYNYLNTPQADVRERSPIHYGTAILRIQDDSVLSGDYFTDRKTTGTMSFCSDKE